MIDYAALEQEIIDDLTIELGKEPSFDVDVLAIKVKSAIKEVIQRRNYRETSLTDEAIASDLENYYTVILNVARYDYNQIGIEGQKTSSENGVSRTYIDRNSLFIGIHPFVKCY